MSTSALPAIVVAAVCVQRDTRRVLLTQRLAGGHLGGAWEFPGGKLEAGESPEEALVREMREECGVTVRVGACIDVTFWRYPNKNVLLLFYEAEITEGTIAHLGVADHAWVTHDALDGYTFPPADTRVLERVRAMLSSP
jgi:8-oxo-dGTP diphosphatase